MTAVGLSGRQLDAKVAEEALGWERTTWEKGKKVAFHLGGGGELPREFTFLARPEHSPVEHYRSEQVEEVGELLALDLPHFSTDMSAAWEVAERFNIGVFPHPDVGGEYYIAGWQGRNDRTAWMEAWLYGGEGTWAKAETAPEAICRAALKAAMEREPS